MNTPGPDRSGLFDTLQTRLGPTKLWPDRATSGQLLGRGGRRWCFSAGGGQHGRLGGSRRK